MTLRAIAKDKEIIAIIDDNKINNRDLVRLITEIYPLNILSLEFAFDEWECKLSDNLYHSLDADVKTLLIMQEGYRDNK